MEHDDINKLIPPNVESDSGQRVVSSVKSGEAGDSRNSHKAQADEGQYPPLRYRPLKWTSPAVVAVLVAALGLFGNIVVAWYNNASSREIERAQQQSAIILQALSPNDVQKTCVNLQFYVNMGLLQDRNGNIVKLICTQPLWGEVPLVGHPTLAPDAGNGVALAKSTSVTPEASEPTPLSGGPPVTASMVHVQRIDSGASASFKVSFVVPNVPNYTFNTVRVYGMRIVENQRVNGTEADYPTLTGNWKPGSSVSFAVEVPKGNADATQGWDLTFCVGSKVSCYPSPNLLTLVKP